MTVVDPIPCPLCGAEWTRKSPDGACAWAGGCEHRQMQTAAASAKFDADYAFHFERLPCGHTEADHAAQTSDFIEQVRAARDAIPFMPPPWAETFIQRIMGWDDDEDDEP